VYDAALTKEKTVTSQWAMGGDKSRALNAVTMAVTDALGGQTDLQVAVNTFAPYAAQQIGEKFGHGEDKNTAAQMTNHAILGATLAYVNNGNPTAGGSAAVVSEAAATYLTNQYYKDHPDPAYQNEKGEFVPNLLPEDVKTQIRDLTAVVGGTVGDSSFNAQLAGVVGQNAVENNYLTKVQILKFNKEMVDCKKNNNCEQVEKKYKDLSIEQQAVMAAVCSMNTVLCKEKYGFIVTSRNDIKKVLDQANNLPAIYSQGLLKQQIDAEGMVWNTELAHQFKEKFNLTDEQATYLVSVASGIGIGGKIIKGKVSANVDKRLPVSTPTVANNGLIYKSNPKHTLGGEGNRLNAGIEPKNSLALFNKSIPVSGDSNKRYSVDSKGNIHQFTY